MKIIFYSDSLEYGGAEKYLNDIVSGFCSEKNKLYVVCSTFKAFGEAEKKTGVEIIKIRPKSVFDFLSFLQLLIFFLKISPDIVFINFRNTFSCQHGAIAAFFAFRKTIGFLHAAELPNKCEKIGVLLRRFIAQNLFSRIGRLICTSKYVADIAISTYKCNPDKVRKIYHGVEQKPLSSLFIKAFINDYDLYNKKIIVCVSRLAPEKGLEVLIVSFKKVLEKIPDAMLIIVGAGSLLYDLRALALSLMIADSVLFLGFREDVQNFIEMSDVVVVPSLNESLSYAVLEAMMQTKPIIATRVGGIPEVIIENCGLLVPPNNAAKLSDEIINLLYDNKKAMELAINGHKRGLSCFSKDKMFYEIKKCVNEFIERGML